MMKFAQALRRMRQEEKGFTLVELMVVIVIIGILAAVAIPKFGQIMADSRFKADAASAKVFSDAIDRYYVQQGVYPWVAGEAPYDIATELVAKNLLELPKIAQGSYSSLATTDAAYAAAFNDVYQLNNAPGDNQTKPQIKSHNITVPVGGAGEFQAINY